MVVRVASRRVPDPSRCDRPPDDPNLIARARDARRHGRRAGCRVVAPATIAAYERDWQHFGGWCHAYRIDPVDADPMPVASWIAELANRGLTVATMHRRLAAVSYAFGLLNQRSPVDDLSSERRWPVPAAG